MAIQVVNAVARVLWSTGAGPDKRRRVLVAARRIAVRGDHSRLLSTVGFLGLLDDEPLTSELLAVADAAGPQAADNACRIALAGLLAGQVTHRDLPFDDRVLAELRANGRRMLLMRALYVQAYRGLLPGRWDVAVAAAEEAIRLAAAAARPLDRAAARGVLAVIAAFRGDRLTVEGLTDKIDRTSLPIGAAPLIAIARAARGLLAMGDGDGDGATAHFDRIVDPGDPWHDPGLPWSDRASQELRASGETSRQRVPEARDQLSPQEVQVAGLAASGLSEPRDRRETLPLAPDGRLAPVSDLSQAGDHVAR